MRGHWRLSLFLRGAAVRGELASGPHSVFLKRVAVGGKGVPKQELCLVLRSPQAAKYSAPVSGLQARIRLAIAMASGPSISLLSSLKLTRAASRRLLVKPMIIRTGGSERKREQTVNILLTILGTICHGRARRARGTRGAGLGGSWRAERRQTGTLDVRTGGWAAVGSGRGRAAEQRGRSWLTGTRREQWKTIQLKRTTKALKKQAKPAAPTMERDSFELTHD